MKTAKTEHDREKDRDFLDTLNSPECMYISKIKIIEMIDEMIRNFKGYAPKSCEEYYSLLMDETDFRLALTELKSKIQQGG